MVSGRFLGQSVVCYQVIFYDKFILIDIIVVSILLKSTYYVKASICVNINYLNTGLTLGMLQYVLFIKLKRNNNHHSVFQFIEIINLVTII